MIGDHLTTYTYEYLLSTALETVPDIIDKRQGSIIYDALSGCCYDLALSFVELRNAYRDTYAISAQGEALDLRVLEQGLNRYKSTSAIKRAIFKDKSGNLMDVPSNSRFSTVSDVSPINYVVIGPYSENGSVVSGNYELQCELKGVIGNDYSGPLVNITFIRGMEKAEMTDLLIPGRNDETDEELRFRYFEKVNYKPFGGNIAQYDQELRSISGVGEAQIYPVWNGGGTVKCSILDSEFNLPSAQFLSYVQNLIDPENAQGNSGVGLGMVPIGHKVTIVSPTEFMINVAAKVELKPGISLPQVTDEITKRLQDYFTQIKKSWGVPYQYNVYQSKVFVSQVIATISLIPSINNVTNVSLNGAAMDIALTQNATVQQVPKLGSVVIT